MKQLKICFLMVVFLSTAITTLTPAINNANNDLSHNKDRVLVRSRRNVFAAKQDPSQRHIVAGEEKAASNGTGPSQRPRFKISRNTMISFDPFLYKCNEKTTVHCQNLTAKFRHKIVSEFKKSMAESKATFVDETSYLYNVQRRQHSIINPLCAVMMANVRCLKRSDFRGGNEQRHHSSIIAALPTRPLFVSDHEMSELKQSCAIVSSAGSLAKSGLGRFIDLHDIVMRFNHAPVEGYEADVGRKSTIRVVNSQVVSKPEFNFVESPMFQNISIAAWDPGKFNGTLSEWLTGPDFNLFDNVREFMKKSPAANLHLVDPRSIWQLWKALQHHSVGNVPKNPPSSGFIGLALLLPVCSYVDFVEYVPSTRLSSRCHYYDDEQNSACTFGSWHPLAAEKLMALDMNSADEFTVFQNGVIRIRRPSKASCK